MYPSICPGLKTGKECLHYISQHRKLCDDIIPITQAVGNVDKQFRSIAQDFSVIRNEYTAKYGIFKGRGRFVRKTFDSFTGDSQRQVPFETASFRLDAAGVASCYNTSAGVGVLNRGEGDKLKPAKGIPIMAVIPFLAVVVVVVTLIPKIASSLFADNIADRVPTVAQASAYPQTSISASPAESQVSVEVESDPEPESDPVFWTGMMKEDGIIRIWLSDGRRLSTSRLSDGITSVTRDYVVVDGERIYKPVR